MLSVSPHGIPQTPAIAHDFPDGDRLELDGTRIRDVKPVSVGRGFALSKLLFSLQHLDRDSEARHARSHSISSVHPRSLFRLRILRVRKKMFNREWCFNLCV